MRIIFALMILAGALTGPAHANNQTGLQRSGQVSYTGHPYTTARPVYNSASTSYSGTNGQYTSHSYSYAGSNPQSVAQTSAMDAAVARSLRTSAAY